MIIEINPSGAALAAAASLHHEALPGSIITQLGSSYTQAFYRFARSSRDEAIFIARSDVEGVLGAAVLSMDPKSLSRRLLFKTPLLFHLASRPLLAIDVACGLFSAAGLPHDRERLPELVAIFSAESCRSRGVGKRLLDAIETYLASRRKSRYVVRTDDDPANRAIAFYRREGFQFAQKFSAHGHRFQLMIKQIDPVTE